MMSDLDVLQVGVNACMPPASIMSPHSTLQLSDSLGGHLLSQASVGPHNRECRTHDNTALLFLSDRLTPSGDACSEKVTGHPGYPPPPPPPPAPHTPPPPPPSPPPPSLPSASLY